MLLSRRQLFRAAGATAALSAAGQMVGAPQALAALTDLDQMTGDSRWLTVAQRFDHAAVFDPLAANQDRLNGLHANTRVPKWIGAAREYKATANGGRILGLAGTAQGAQIVLADDNGSDNNLWRFL